MRSARSPRLPSRRWRAWHRQIRLQQPSRQSPGSPLNGTSRHIRQAPAAEGSPRRAPPNERKPSSWKTRITARIAQQDADDGGCVSRERAKKCLRLVATDECAHHEEPSGRNHLQRAA
jgi:hypothetical protein